MPNDTDREERLEEATRIIERDLRRVVRPGFYGSLGYSVAVRDGLVELVKLQGEEQTVKIQPRLSAKPN